MDINEVISFDIGIKNLAVSYIKYSDISTEQSLDIDFDLFDISAKIPLDRLKNLNNILNNLPKSKLVVIEQQVITNIIAMTIQSAIAIYYLSKDIEVKFYNAKEKFKIDNLKNFKNKEHKKISIGYARNILFKIDRRKLLKFEQFKKKDDIADSICMSLFTLLNDDEKIKSYIH